MRLAHKILISVMVIVLGIVTSCKQNPLRIDVSDIETSINFYRFDSVFFAHTPQELTGTLLTHYDTHKEFIDIYTENVIQIGNIEHETFPEYLYSFITDTVIQKVADTTLVRFSDFNTIANRITKGFAHYKYYFPQKPIPNIYTYVSGFNESLIIADNFVGISLDKYLGSTCEFYNLLGIPRYKIKNMYPQKIISDIFYGWAVTEYPNVDGTNLLSHIIHQGKLMYFTEAMLPSMHDSTLIGYSAEHLKWCKENEAAMWAFLVENKELYKNDRLLLQRYINDSPYTNSFSSESPGRTGIWIGWQIVRSYMEKNKDISLNKLMESTDPQHILNISGYHPE